MKTLLRSAMVLSLGWAFGWRLWAATPGEVDPSFNAGNIYGGVIQQILPLPDGRLIVRGNFSHVQGVPRAGLARLLPDGTLDPSFVPGSGVRGTLSWWDLQSDGQLLLAGTFTNIHGIAKTNLARLRTDGTVDPAFASPLILRTTTPRERRALALEDGGSLEIAANGTSGWGVFRHQPDGAYDSGFERVEVTGTTFPLTLLQPDGRLLLGVRMARFNDGPVLTNALLRLTADGRLDATFAVSAYPTNASQISVLALQPDGRIVVGGTFASTQDLPRNGLARLNPNGSLDPSFDAGQGPDDAVEGMTPLLDGRLLIHGAFASVNGVAQPWLALLASDGRVNEDFHLGTSFSARPNATATQADGRLLIAANFTALGGHGLMRVFGPSDWAGSPPQIVVAPAGHAAEERRSTAFNVVASGGLPLTFQWFRDGVPIGSATNAALALPRVSADDAGDYSVTVANAFGELRSAAARLEVVPAAPRPGRMDLAFVSPFTASRGGNEGVLCVLGQPDGKAILGGDFLRAGSIGCSGIVRLNVDGTVDTTFNSGSGITNRNNPQAVRALAMQTDGRIIIGGEFSSYNAVPRRNLARLQLNGALDTTLNASEITTDRVQALALQPDGKILAGGWFPKRLVRLLPSGKLDAAFRPNIAWSWLHSILVQNDGKIVVCGEAAIRRLNADGSPDMTFGEGLAFDNMVWSLAAAPDGGVVAGGWFTNVKNQPRGGVAWLDANGRLDPRFDPQTGFDQHVNQVLAVPEGRVLATGNFTSYRGTTMRGVGLIGRDGEAAEGFRPGSGPSGGPTTPAAVYGAGVLADGSVIAGGTFEWFSRIVSAAVVRLIDPAQAPAPPRLDTPAKDQVVTEGGRLTLYADARGSIPMTFQWLRDGQVIPGATSFLLELQPATRDLTGDYAVVIVNAAGVRTYAIGHVAVEPPPPTRWTVDPGFAPELWSTPQVTALAVQPDGKVLAGGEFTHVNGALRRHLARLKADGSVDGTFDPGEGPDDYVSSLALQPDGRVMVGGYFRRFGSVKRNAVVRLNADGTLDSTFEFSGKGYVEAMVLQPDGRLILGGAIRTSAQHPLVRVHPDGTVDDTFAAEQTGLIRPLQVTLDRAGRVLVADASGGVVRLQADGSWERGFETSDWEWSVATQADDLILIGGSRVHRLAPDGAADPAWETIPLGRSVQCLTVRSDGRVLAGGYFPAPEGLSGKGLVCLTPSGALDTTFDGRLDDPHAVVIRTLVVTDHDAVLVGGTFAMAGGNAASGLVRLNADGSVDPGFRVQLERSGTVQALAAHGSTNVLVGGEFTMANGSPRLRLASLRHDGTLEPKVNANADAAPNSTVHAILPFGNDFTSQFLIGGEFQQLGPIPSRALASLRNGVLSPVNALSGSSAPAVSALLRQPDDRVLVGGSFGVKRTMPPPSFGSDAMFTTDPINGSVLALASADGATLIVGGSFSTVGGNARPGLTRLKSAVVGASLRYVVDGGFQARLHPEAVVYALATTDEGVVLVGGSFTNVSGQACLNFARLKPDGTFDSLFVPGDGPNDDVRALLGVADGQTLVAGNFTAVGAIPRSRLARLRYDGALDPSFDIGAGANGRIDALLQLDDGSLIVGGEFTAVDGVPRTGLARLVPQTPVEQPEITNPTLAGGTFTVTVATQADRSYQLEYRDALNEPGWVRLPQITGDGTPKLLSDANATGSRRFYRVRVE